MVRTFEEIVHASVFENLLEQAEHLLNETYLLPAAVLAEATLEEHLRRLADKHGVPLAAPDRQGAAVPKMATKLNEDLYSVAKAYSLPEQRQVQVWIDYRNEAAHTKPEFKARIAADISGMLAGIREFMARHPA